MNAITCRMFRQNQGRAVAITEYYAECSRGTEPWQKWPVRMLRHKALIQCARVAFGFSGIYDEDEAERIIESSGTVIQGSKTINVEGAPIPNMSAAANADVRQATQQQAAKPTTIDAAPASKPAEAKSTTQTAPAATAPAPTTAVASAPATQAPSTPPAARATAGGLAKPDPDPFQATVDGQLKIRGTVTAIYAPKKAGSGVKMGMKMHDLNLSDWHGSHHPYLKGEAGVPGPKDQVCQFICSKNGDFINVEKIEWIGPTEFDTDSEGKLTPVIRRDEVIEEGDPLEIGDADAPPSDGAPHPADDDQGSLLGN